MLEKYAFGDQISTIWVGGQLRYCEILLDLHKDLLDLPAPVVLTFIQLAEGHQNVQATSLSFLAPVFAINNFKNNAAAGLWSLRDLFNTLIDSFNLLGTTSQSLPCHHHTVGSLCEFCS